MKRNLTLAIEDTVLERARLAAVRRRQSLTSLVREFLERLGQDDELRAQAARRLQRAMRSRPIEVGPRRWTRDDLHDR